MGEEGVGVGDGVEEDNGVCCFGEVDREAAMQIGTAGDVVTGVA